MELWYIQYWTRYILRPNQNIIFWQEEHGDSHDLCSFLPLLLIANVIKSLYRLLSNRQPQQPISPFSSSARLRKEIFNGPPREYIYMCIKIFAINNCLNIKKRYHMMLSLELFLNFLTIQRRYKKTLLSIAFLELLGFLSSEASENRRICH